MAKEKGTTYKTTIRPDLDPETDKLFRLIVEAKNESMQDLVAKFIEKYVKQNKHVLKDLIDNIG